MKSIVLLTVLSISLSFAETPTEVLKQYKASAQAKDFEATWKHTAQFEGLPEAASAYFKDKVQRIVGIMGDDWDFEILEEKIEGGCAVIVISENQKAGNASFDIDPVYLIQQNETWKVLPEFTNWRNAGEIIKDQVPTLEKLKVWYKGRKAELKEAHSK